MEDGIASANRRVLLPERLPGKSDARLEGGFVEFNADAAVRIRSRNQIVAAAEALPQVLLKSKFAWRPWASVIGVVRAHANPRFRVRLGVTRQSSCT